MRLYSAYINRQAAKDAQSVFDPERYVKRIYKDGANMWELAQKEEEDNEEFESAEKQAEINKITEMENREMKDIEELVNKTYMVIRDAMLLIHTQLDELKSIVREDEILKASGFPIEVADQLEGMLKQEIANIVSHLNDMAREIRDENEDGREAQ